MTTAHQLAETVKIALADYQKIVKMVKHQTIEEHEKFEAEVLKYMLECFAAQAAALDAEAA